MMKGAALRRCASFPLISRTRKDEIRASGRLRIYGDHRVLGRSELCLQKSKLEGCSLRRSAALSDSTGLRSAFSSLRHGEAFGNVKEEDGLPELAKLLREPSWLQALGREFQEPYMCRLNNFIGQEVARNEHIYPPPALVFHAFHTCPFDTVKAVIIGQDPYHGRGQATGLAFSVPPGVQIPSSLANIFKELCSDLNCDVPPHGDLGHWCRQGVLLLNTSLTVREQQPASHAKKGWEVFTDAVITALSDRRKGLVFMLWGKHAQEKSSLIDQAKHHVLMASHPSGLSAARGFFGCRHFSKTNELLLAEGQAPIDWQVE